MARHYRDRDEVRGIKHFCPACEWDCPYCKGPDAVCTLPNPREECDTYYYYDALEEEDEYFWMKEGE